MSHDPISFLVERLVRAERAMHAECVHVGARLEDASSALLALRLACHVDETLEDLGLIAERQGSAGENVWSRLRTFSDDVFEWFSSVWPRTASSAYAVIVSTMRREIELARELHDAADSAGDAVLAEWCAVWIDQRARLVDGLAESVAEAMQAPVAEPSALVALPTR